MTGGFLKPTWLLVCIFAGVGACRPFDTESFAEHHTTVAERAFADSYLALLQNGGIDSAFALLVPALQTARARQDLQKVGAVLETHPPEALELIGAQINDHPGRRSVRLTWQYQSRGSWVFASVSAEHRPSGPMSVSGVQATLMGQSLSAMNAFTVQDKSPLHWVWLALVLLIPLLCLGAAARVASAKGMPKRWRWAAASLVGVGTISLDWTSGALGANVLWLHLLGAAVERSGPAAPWILTISVPIPAVLALKRYRSWRANSTAILILLACQI